MISGGNYNIQNLSFSIEPFTQPWLSCVTYVSFGAEESQM